MSWTYVDMMSCSVYSPLVLFYVESMNREYICSDVCVSLSSALVRVLYEDEHLLVVNKPPGLAVQPCESQPSGTLLHGVLHHLMYNSR